MHGTKINSVLVAEVGVVTIGICHLQTTNGVSLSGGWVQRSRWKDVGQWDEYKISPIPDCNCPCIELY